MKPAPSSFDSREDKALRVHQRRAGRDAARVNAAIWAVGNGLVGSTLIIYLVQDLAREQTPRQLNLLIAWILAAPHLAGIARMATPALTEIVGGRKRLCLIGYVVSAGFLACIPGIPFLLTNGSLETMIGAIAAAWAFYHLFEYLATVSLWSTLRDLTSTRLRGRFIGQRERWLLIGQVSAMTAAGLFNWAWPRWRPDDARWIPQAICAGGGACFMLLAVAPLLRLPDLPPPRIRSWRERLVAFWRPLVDPPFARLMLFGCWLSICNGVTQSAQGRYPYVLGVHLFVLLGLGAVMRLGQSAISQPLGRLVDRLGSRPVMLVTLPLVALGPLFYFFAGMERQGSGTGLLPVEFWVACAWLIWIAWAGVNVSLPALMLRLPSHRVDASAHIATYYALSGVCYAMATLAGGAMLDALGNWRLHLTADKSFDKFQIALLAGWFLRTSGVFLLLWAVRVDDVRHDAS